MDLTSDIDFRLTTTAGQRLGPSMYRGIFGDEASEIFWKKRLQFKDLVSSLAVSPTFTFLFVFRPVCSIVSRRRSFVITVDSEGTFVELGCDTIVHMFVSLVVAVP